MRPTPNLAVERFRIRVGRLASSRFDGNNGAFEIPLRPGRAAYVITSDGLGWEHVSVSIVGEQRCPTWEEMCDVKDLFWGPDECVVQFHPPQSEYRNLHEHCLHLWRPTDAVIPRPDPETVAPAKFAKAGAR